MGKNIKPAISPEQAALIDSVRGPMRCGRTSAAHDLNWVRVIQAIKHGTWRDVTDIHLDGKTIVFRDHEGQIVRGWNHDPERIELLIAAGGPVQFKASPYNLLGFVNRTGWSMVGLELGEYKDNCDSAPLDGFTLNPRDPNLVDNATHALRKLLKDQEEYEERQQRDQQEQPEQEDSASRRQPEQEGAQEGDAQD